VHHRSRLVAQVQFLADLLPEAVEHLEQPTGGLVTGLSGDYLEQRLEHVQIGCDDSMDERPEDLHTDDPPVVKPRPVHHGDRRATHRLRIDLRVGVLHRHAEVGLDAVLYLFEPDDRSGVQTGPELVGDGLAEHAG